MNRINDVSGLDNALLKVHNKKNVRQVSYSDAGLLSEHTLLSTYETVNQNLNTYPYSLTYSGGNVATITYDLGGGLSILKTFSYSAGKLISVVLSGDLPLELEYLTKTLTYTGANLTSVSYS